MTECGNLPALLCLWWLIRKCHFVLPYSRGKPVSILFQDAHETCRDPSFFCQYRTFSSLPPSSTITNILSVGTAWAQSEAISLFPFCALSLACLVLIQARLPLTLKKKKTLKCDYIICSPFLSLIPPMYPHPALFWNHNLFFFTYYCYISMYMYYA